MSHVFLSFSPARAACLQKTLDDLSVQDLIRASAKILNDGLMRIVICLRLSSLRNIVIRIDTVMISCTTHLYALFMSRRFSPSNSLS